jgi:osmotically-inducible protein OsmY
VVNAAQLTAALTERLEKFLLQGGSTQIEVSVENRTASLEGSVNSDDDRRLAERLVSLEPGVDRIENRLVVEPASTGEAAGLDR